MQDKNTWSAPDPHFIGVSNSDLCRAMEEKESLPIWSQKKKAEFYKRREKWEDLHRATTDIVPEDADCTSGDYDFGLADPM